MHTIYRDKFLHYVDHYEELFFYLQRFANNIKI